MLVSNRTLPAVFIDSHKIGGRFQLAWWERLQFLEDMIEWAHIHYRTPAPCGSNGYVS
jgi:hypothetical protein